MPLIVKLCQELDKKKGVTKILMSQLLRSGTSIGANIEEAQFAQSKRDFICKASISTKKAREILYWLKILKETVLQEDKAIDDLIKRNRRNR